MVSYVPVFIATRKIISPHLSRSIGLLGGCLSSQPTKSLTYRAEEGAHNCLSASIDSPSLNLERLENSIGMCPESFHTKTET